ncbi:Rieske 2Fe-2S domain-containing protein [Pigmentiphaga soli]|uniref:Rieske 2Fe-2S domain-containing protein n=1 Tax=Pigmentiphaga soli TaxID=1007095 RepID=A0ABP8HAF2_9BURK
MLNAADNTLLTQVGPGTPMGNLFRRFWLPALLEEELAEPDGAPVKLRLLGEDLVAFRATDGRIGILDAYCAHRRVHLYFGRNEENGIRCVYHGWKFGVDGQCLETPSEPVDNGIARRVKLTSYPAAERGGVIWVYMGGDAPPPLPDFEWSRMPETQRTVTKRVQRSNWAQAVEGGIDSSHVSFLHKHNVKQPNPFKFQDSPLSWKYLELDRHPVFSVDDADYGLLINARRNADPGTYYWRVTQFLLPFYTLTPPTVDPDGCERAAYYGHAWVPIDDHQCWTWSFHASPHHVYSPEEREFLQGRNGIWGPIDERYYPTLNMDNDYGLDRDRQRRDNFTGIDGIQNQDAAVQESMGTIVDRSKERLGQSDLAIVRFRRLMLKLARELQAGQAPRAAAAGELFNVRPVTVLLPAGVPVAQGAARLMHAAATPQENLAPMPG